MTDENTTNNDQTGSSSRYPKAVTLEDFEQLKLTAGLYLFDFWATWCGPCKVMNPIIDSLSEDPELAKLNFVSVDVDDQPELSGMFRVNSIPTFLVIKFKGDGTFDKETDIMEKAIGAQSAFDFKLLLLKAIEKSEQ